MDLYRKKGGAVSVFRWFKKGDHPDDGEEVDEEGNLCDGRVIELKKL
jgi:hypothetical protein